MPDLLSDPEYSYAVHEEATGNTINGDWTPAGSNIFISTYTGPAPATRFSGRILPELAVAKSIATIGPYELLSAEASNCAGTVRLITSWQPISESGSRRVIAPSTSIFAQLLNEEGELTAQADGPVLGLRPDLLQVPPGWKLMDVREFEIGDNRPGEILIGAYDFVSGDRFSAQNGEKEDLPDDAFRVPLGECTS